MSDGLRRRLRGEGVYVGLIKPGNIATDMNPRCDAHCTVQFTRTVANCAAAAAATATTATTTTTVAPTTHRLLGSRRPTLES